MDKESKFNQSFISILTSTSLRISPAAHSKVQISTTIKTTEISAQGNRANTEGSHDTENLFNPTDLTSNPLISVYTLPATIYSNNENCGSAGASGAISKGNIFYINNVQSAYIPHLFGGSSINENLVQELGLYSSTSGSQHGNTTGGFFDVNRNKARVQKLVKTIKSRSNCLCLNTKQVAIKAISKVPQTLVF